MRGLDTIATGMASARRHLGIAPDRFVVLHAGGLAPRAGADTAIHGLAMLRTCWGADADLIVAAGTIQGQQDARLAQLARLRAIAADRGIAAQVRFAGPSGQEGLRDYYLAADVVASTPWYGPCGGTAAAAMACARPVIGTQVDGIEGMIVDGVTGFLIPARDAEALAERLDRLYRRPALAQSMGQAGHRRLRALRRRAVAGYENADAGRGDTHLLLPCGASGALG